MQMQMSELKHVVIILPHSIQSFRTIYVQTNLAVLHVFIYHNILCEITSREITSRVITENCD